MNEYFVVVVGEAVVVDEKEVTVTGSVKHKSKSKRTQSSVTLGRVKVGVVGVVNPQRHRVT